MSRAEDLRAAVAPELAVTLSAAEAACQVAEKIALQSGGDFPPLIGINGAQGSGKSTLSLLIAEALARFHDWHAVTLSLDDFYLTRAERQRLANTVHPLCATRGVPGTHDVVLLAATIDRLVQAGAATPTLLPRFDKLADDRERITQWPSFTGRPDAILLEGWCAGIARADLPPYAGPINALEQAEDPDGAWFRWSLDALGHGYEDIWQRFSLLLSIEVPDLDTVIDSRLKQEEGLSSGSGRAKMDRAAITRFVQHYERYTRALWAAMPGKADMLFRRTRDFGFTLVKE